MVRDGRSPRITRLSWGRIEVEGGRSFKDAKLWPGGVREWDWKETGTRDRPGVQPADAEELLEHGAEVVSLRLGRRLRMHGCRLAIRQVARVFFLIKCDARLAHDEIPRWQDAAIAEIHPTDVACCWTQTCGAILSMTMQPLSSGASSKQVRSLLW